jgi:hypothetical protein
MKDTQQRLAEAFGAKPFNESRFGKAVVDLCERDIKKVMDEQPGISRQDAAKKILASKERWYIQTEEGEYLDAVSRGQKVD